ncbi:hypothetical protein LOC67_06605 [Stieleria sp. JC731]|nr:hypothetical protein [Stieleria sp. JC731]MCC9600225.1 hypothetical protein [Stieleria sp. JC731]
MQGQGSPSERSNVFRDRPTGVLLMRVMPTELLLHVLVVISLIIAIADSKRQACAANPVANVHQRSAKFQSLYDGTTKPFRLRCSRASWPITNVSDSSALSVSIDSLASHAGARLRLQYELVQVQSGNVVAREQTQVTLDSEGNSEPISIASDSPDQAGVYEIRLRLLEPKDKIWDRFSLRDSETVAQIQTPWVTVEAASSELNVASELELGASTTIPLRWISVGAATRFDANHWIGTRWIPDATRFVPGAKRVGESLPIPSWRDESPLKDQLLKAKANVIAVMPAIASGELGQIRLSLQSASNLKEPTKLLIEVSPTPEFDGPVQEQFLSIAPQIDAALPQPIKLGDVNVLHRGSGEPQFVRLTNQNEVGDFSILSFELFRRSLPSEQSAEEQAQASGDGGGQTRELIWSTNSWRWAGQLVDAPTRASISGRFAASTSLLHVIEMATRRIDDHASWLQYDKILVRLGGAEPHNHLIDRRVLEQLVQFESNIELELSSQIAFEAFENWSQSIGTTVDVIRHPGSQTIDAAVVDISPVDDVEGHALVEPLRNTDLIERIVRDSPARIVIKSDSIPVAIDAQLQNTIAQIRMIPLSMRTIPSSDASSSQLGVHVFSTTGPQQSTRLTIINEAPWTNEVRLATPSAVRLVDLVSSTVYSSDDKIVLGPSSMMNLIAEESNLSIRSWQANFQSQDLAVENVKSLVSTVVNQIGTLGSPGEYGGLRNGDFETPGKVGIVGWMHTQYPADAIQLDAQEASQGDHSIRMFSNAQINGGVWIVSEPIKVPVSGRLAVSMAIRAEAKPVVNPIRQTAAEMMLNLDAGTIANASGTAASNLSGNPSEGAAGAEIAKNDAKPRPPSHDIRVSLEGIRGGEPVRFISQLSVPSDGQWQTKKNVLEIDGLDPADLETIRLTIDSLSPGKLWIDEIRLHHEFATKAERSHLQGKVFLAIQGLQRGQYAPAAELLRNRWARHLLTQSDSHVRVPSSGAGGRNSEKELQPTAELNSTEDSPNKENRESVAERIRDWLPRPIRF